VEVHYVSKVLILPKEKKRERSGNMPIIDRASATGVAAVTIEMRPCQDRQPGKCAQWCSNRSFVASSFGVSLTEGPERVLMHISKSTP